MHLALTLLVAHLAAGPAPDGLPPGREDAAAARKAEAVEQPRKGQPPARPTAAKEVRTALAAARRAKDWTRVLELADQAVARDPQLRTSVLGPRFAALLHLDEAKAQALVDAERAARNGDLFPLAVAAVQEEGLDPRWYRFAAEVQEHPAPLPEDIQRNNEWVLAKAYARLGRFPEAVAVQARVVAWLKAQAHLQASLVEENERALEDYRAGRVGSAGGAR